MSICKDRDEYFKYGGPRGSAGYWNNKSEELVLYDGTKREKGEKTDKLDTFIVLYHEAFHQYIHYSAGELAPHSWYNEGMGDYYAGGKFKFGKLQIGKSTLPGIGRRSSSSAIVSSRNTSSPRTNCLALCTNKPPPCTKGI